MKLSRRELESRLGAFAFTSAQRWLLRKRPDRAELTGERLGRAIYRASKKHRRRAIDNLRLAFPEMSHIGREALARRVFEHFGRVTADFLVSSNRTAEQLDESMTVEGKEYIDAALALGKGVVMITGHFGNWERMAAWLSTHGYPVTVVQRDARNTTLNQMVQDLREKPGTRVIGRGDAARPMIERLRANEIIGILPDQNSDEIYVPFFGKPAGTVLGPGVIAERTGSPVVPAWCIWEGPGRYRMIVQPPLVAEPGYSVKGEGITRAITASLEAIVRRYPEQWLWFHDRWKNARRKGLL
jgi:KDO2-lipid IV(A) lauroyltransferase